MTRRRLNHNSDLPKLAQECGFKARTLLEMLGVSRWALYRHVKKSFGQSPTAWLNMRRLILATDMLEDSDSIKFVALELGYKSQSHFCHQFKRRYAMSPTEFLARRRHALNGKRSPLPTAIGRDPRSQKEGMRHRQTTLFPSNPPTGA